MGPLAGLKVIEMAGLAPGPFCAMMLADMGADVLRVERPGASEWGHDPRLYLLNRSRQTVTVNLKAPDGLAAVKRLLTGADVLIEGFRPGVMERLGLGPDDCLRANPRLVYGRMTGWGQDGPLADAAAHDLNYIALAGALYSREGLPAREDRAGWPVIRRRFSEVFRSRTRDEWTALLEGTDACFAPALTIPEALAHPHNRTRGTFVEIEGVVQPAPAPRFSRSTPDAPRLPDVPASGGDEAWMRWGFGEEEVAELPRREAIG
jgi:crotonobetainyl-CoA:carnitine CoA-transferase CaiB-like acyl-CoA transferase